MSMRGFTITSLLWLDAIAIGLIMPAFLAQLFSLGGSFLNLDDSGRFMGFFVGFIIVFFPPSTLFLLFSGWLTDRWNRLFALWLGFGSTALCFLCLLVADHLTPILFSLCVVLFSLRAAGIAAMKAFISDSYTQQKRAKYFGIYTARYNLMAFVFYVTTYGLDRVINPVEAAKLCNRVALAIMLLTLLLLACFQYQTRTQIASAQPTSYRINHNTFTDFLMDIGRLLNNKRLLVLLAAFLLSQFAYGICEQYRDSYFAHNYVYENVEVLSTHFWGALWGVTHYYVDEVCFLSISFFGPLLSIAAIFFIYIPLSRFVRMERLLLVACTLCLILAMFAWIDNIRVLRVLSLITTHALLPAFILPALFTLMANAGHPYLQGTLMAIVEVVWRLGWILAGLILENVHFQYSLFPIAIAIVALTAEWVCLMWFFKWRTARRIKP